MSEKRLRCLDILFRYRANRNSFTWGPLIRVLVDNGFSPEPLKKKAFPPSEHFAGKPGVPILYLDSFMSIDLDRAAADLDKIRAAVASSGRPFFSAAGGAHPTADPETTLLLGFDVAIRGEGEVSLVELANALEAGCMPCDVDTAVDGKEKKVVCNPNLRSVHNICFRPRDLPQCTGKSQPQPLSSASNGNCGGDDDAQTKAMRESVFGKYGEEEKETAKMVLKIKEMKARNGDVAMVRTDMAAPVDLDDYTPYCELPALHPPIEIMRGCTNGCMYCQTPRLCKGRVRFRSLEKIELIVADYAKRFPAPLDLRIIAPNSLGYQSVDGRTPNIPALRGLLDIARRYNARLYLGSFPSEVRPDFVTPETVQILKECNAPMVAVGAQAGSDTELKRMCRGHTVQQVLDAVHLMRAADLVPNVDFILCCPKETEDEQCATVSFAQTLLDLGCHIRLHHFMPLPGTPWADLPPSELYPKTIPLLNPLLGNPCVEGAFARQKDDNTIVADDRNNRDNPKKKKPKKEQPKQAK